MNQITAPFPIQPLWLVWYVVETITSLHQIDKTNLSPLLDGSLLDSEVQSQFRDKRLGNKSRCCCNAKLSFRRRRRKHCL